MTLFRKDAGIAKMALAFMSEAEFRGGGLDGIGVRSDDGQTECDMMPNIIQTGWLEGLTELFATSGIVSKINKSDMPPELIHDVADHGHIKMLKFLVRCFPDQHNSALGWSACCNQVHAMKMFKVQDIAELNHVFINDAAECESLQAMKLLRNWGANDIDGALIGAAATTNICAMKLARKWGAKCTYAIFKLAERSNFDPKVIKLIKRWSKQI